MITMCPHGTYIKKYLGYKKVTLKCYVYIVNRHAVVTCSSENLVLESGHKI